VCNGIVLIIDCYIRYKFPIQSGRTDKTQMVRKSGTLASIIVNNNLLVSFAFSQQMQALPLIKKFSWVLLLVFLLVLTKVILFKGSPHYYKNYFRTTYHNYKIKEGI